MELLRELLAEAPKSGNPTKSGEVTTLKPRNKLLHDALASKRSAVIPSKTDYNRKQDKQNLRKDVREAAVDN